MVMPSKKKNFRELVAPVVQSSQQFSSNRFDSNTVRRNFYHFRLTAILCSLPLDPCRNFSKCLLWLENVPRTKAFVRFVILKWRFGISLWIQWSRWIMTLFWFQFRSSLPAMEGQSCGRRRDGTRPENVTNTLLWIDVIMILKVKIQRDMDRYFIFSFLSLHSYCFIINRNFLLETTIIPNHLVEH